MNHWKATLEQIDDGSQSTRAIADIVGCHIRTVRYHRRRRGINPRTTTLQYRRCQLIPDERNPLGFTGLCLYCRLEQKGIDLLDWHESGDAARYYNGNHTGNPAMNVQDVIEALQPAAGNRILLIPNTDTNVTLIAQNCISVEHLPPDQRQDRQGNVILWNGLTDTDGVPTGRTFWARDVLSIQWRNNVVAHIHTNDHVVMLIALQKLLPSDAGK